MFLKHNIRPHPDGRPQQSKSERQYTALKKTLVIVESPAKGKTISRFLGPEYRVEASMGHIRDLPTQKKDLPEEIQKQKWADFAVNVDDKFQPYYVVTPEKKKQISMLKKALTECDAMLLATDEDREGEAISWHLMEVLKPKVPVKRIVFHEITREAITEALENPRQVDANLVRAQESRRVLDRLFGYRLSPLLWRKIQQGLSAGRVQSPAIRLIVEREEERRAFVSATYFDLEAQIAHPGGTQFKAVLASLNDRKLAGGKDFDPTTGELKNAKAKWLNAAEAVDLCTQLRAGLPWTIASIDETPATQRPYAPFTTSSLQQEASRKLRFSSKKTMQIAQTLYEGVELGGGERVGLITYMRTDSTTLSEKALKEAQDLISRIYGPEYTSGPRRYQTKARNAQEAHEAIRPTELPRKPADVAHHLDKDHLALYELIWKRTIASQMTDARLLRTSVLIDAQTPDKAVKATFSATGKTILFPGFMRAYVEGSDDPAADLGDKEVLLPSDLRPGQCVGHAAPPADLSLAELAEKGHATEPPARYTEASLVKKLEEEGIGRPSTYAAIISTIQDRGYVNLNKSRQLVPTFNAFMVVKFLRDTFPRYVDIKFTAGMEEDLDMIADGKVEWVDYLRRFYHGGETEAGLNATVDQAAALAQRPEIVLGQDSASGKDVVIRSGKFGAYLSLGRETGCPMADVPADVAPADLTVEQALELLKNKSNTGVVLGNDPATAEVILLVKGQYGYYVQRGETPADKKASKPPRAQVPKEMNPDTLSLDVALQLLLLPRLLGNHPEKGKPITATFGPYGPYVACERECRSIAAPDTVFNITLDKALELLAKPKASRKLESPIDLGEGVFVKPGRFGPYVTDGTVNATVTRGTDPHSLTLAEARVLLAAKASGATSKTGATGATGGRDLGEGVAVKAGKFGPYVTDGTINATLPKGTNPDGVTLAEAQELLAAKRAKGPSVSRGRKKA